MPPPGADRLEPRIGLAALSFVVSMVHVPNDSARMLTVPLHQAEMHTVDLPSVSISGDGRFVAFVSGAALVPADVNGSDDVYVLDRQSGAITLETADSPLGSSNRPAISATGRFLVYETAARVLMLRDRVSGDVRPLQRGREPPNGSSRAASIAADGRYVAFTSGATNLVDEPDANGAGEDVFVADTTSMTFRRISKATAASPSTVVSSFAPAISEDGRFVAFSSTALVDGGGKARTINAYLYDMRTGATTRVSVGVNGDPPDGSSYSPAISADGRYVAFVSDATNLVHRRDRNKLPDVYLRDTIAMVTELVSRTPSGDTGNGPSRHPAVSGDGRVVVFQSEASDLICGTRCPLAERDINLVADIFRRDRQSGVTERISRGRDPWMEPSLGPAVDRGGGVVAFASRHPVDENDDRHDYDLFVWTRE